MATAAGATGAKAQHALQVRGERGVEAKDGEEHPPLAGLKAQQQERRAMLNSQLLHTEEAVEVAATGVLTTIATQGAAAVPARKHQAVLVTQLLQGHQPQQWEQRLLCQLLC